MKKWTVLCAALLCLAAVPAFAAPGATGSTTCVDRIDGGTVPNNLYVPAGATCTLSWSEVVGNATVDGTLISFDSKFDRNITVTGTISLINGYDFRPIVGNLSIINSAGQSGIYCPNTANVINGSITVTGLHDGGSFYICSAQVGGGVTLANNLGRIDISYMNIGKGLDCYGNDPAPISWSVNVGYGSSIIATNGKTGQCSVL